MIVPPEKGMRHRCPQDCGHLVDSSSTPDTNKAPGGPTNSTRATFQLQEHKLCHSNEYLRTLRH